MNLALLVASTSHTSAPESVATVASFRTWRGSQHIVAKGPMLATYSSTSEREGFEPSIRYERIHAFQACSFNRSDISPVEARKVKLERSGVQMV